MATEQTEKYRAAPAGKSRWIVRDFIGMVGGEKRRVPCPNVRKKPAKARSPKDESDKARLAAKRLGRTAVPKHAEDSRTGLIVPNPAWGRDRNERRRARQALRKRGGVVG
jgi:hypothetical protein